MMDLKTPSLLVIEDDLDTLTKLRNTLELDAYQIDQATTAAEALDRNEWSRYLAILLDRRLPDGSAEELLPQLRRLAPEAAVIIVTGHADVEGAISALRLGAADYLLKPIDPSELRARLGGIAKRRRAEARALQAERLAAIGQMVAALTHESGNALQRSQACLHMLALEVGDQPRAMELIDRQQRALDDLTRLYEEVRNYAVPIRLEQRPCDLSSLWRLAWADLEASRAGREARLHEEVVGSDLRYMADPHRLGQVFRNLLENALAVCPTPIEIEIRCSPCTLEGRPAVRIAVRDNGPGLEPRLRERVFEPF